MLTCEICGKEVQIERFQNYFSLNLSDDIVHYFCSYGCMHEWDNRRKNNMASTHVSDVNSYEIKDSKNNKIILNRCNTSIKEKKAKIVLGKEKGRFVPTHLGILVNSFLMAYFPKIMDYKFTSMMEDKLDDVANGTLSWTTVMKDFYNEFHPLVAKQLKLAPEIQNKDSRLLGTDPESGFQLPQ